ncbi:MAG: signal peptidase I [Clostridiales bacterium]|nr:signal peptidase I [Clostridiales bacterium]
MPFPQKRCINTYTLVLIVIGSEWIRKTVLAQESKWANVFAYLIGVLSEVLIFAGMKNIHTFNQFMDLFALYFFPAIISNLLYNYLAKRYGMLPNVLYRLPFTLVPYLLTVVPALPDALFAFAKLFIPLLLYGLVSLLYEKKRKVAGKKNRKWAYVFAVLPVLFLAMYVMLISCQFTFGMLVIGSESMTGEINKGDAVIYREYEGQRIDVGDVIVFEKDGYRLVHRVVDKEFVNGQTRYTTKGDFNEKEDSGFITDGQIIGVTSFKIPYLGYPTLWMRDWFH